MEHIDCLVVGCGLSGICCAYRCQSMCPDKTFAILESRDCMGGTWDLFRYPGIRSDSDMYTLGFRFNPWTSTKTIADGDTILEYLHSTVKKFELDKHIRYGQKVVCAKWSTESACYLVEVVNPITKESKLTFFSWRLGTTIMKFPIKPSYLGSRSSKVSLSILSSGMLHTTMIAKRWSLLGLEQLL